MPSPVGLIYLITNLVNGKQYVGQTTNTLKARWYGHCGKAARQRSSLIALAIGKHGRKNFRVVSLTSADSINELNDLEEVYIARLGTISPRGYNLDAGGKNYARHPDTGRKISAKRKGQKLGPYPPRSEEHCRNISLAKKGRPGFMLGRKWSGESRARLRESIKNRPGHAHTEEFKQRLSERNRGNAYALGYKQLPEHVGPRIANSTRTRRKNAARS